MGMTGTEPTDSWSDLPVCQGWACQWGRAGGPSWEMDLWNSCRVIIDPSPHRSWSHLVREDTPRRVKESRQPRRAGDLRKDWLMMMRGQILPLINPRKRMDLDLQRNKRVKERKRRNQKKHLLRNQNILSREIHQSMKKPTQIMKNLTNLKNLNKMNKKTGLRRNLKNQNQCSMKNQPWLQLGQHLHHNKLLQNK